MDGKSQFWNKREKEILQSLLKNVQKMSSIIILNGSRHNTMVMTFIQIKLRWFAVKNRNG